MLKLPPSFTASNTLEGQEGCKLPARIIRKEATFIEGGGNLFGFGVSLDLKIIRAADVKFVWTTCYRIGGAGYIPESDNQTIFRIDAIGDELPPEVYHVRAIISHYSCEGWKGGTYCKGQRGRWTENIHPQLFLSIGLYTGDNTK